MLIIVIWLYSTGNTILSLTSRSCLSQKREPDTMVLKMLFIVSFFFTKCIIRFHPPLPYETIEIHRLAPRRDKQLQSRFMERGLLGEKTVPDKLRNSTNLVLVISRITQELGIIRMINRTQYFKWPLLRAAHIREWDYAALSED